MSAGSIDGLWHYALKGAQGVEQECLNVDPAVGVQNDRQYALRRKPGDMNEWAPKAAFFVCMNTPGMAAESPVFRGGSSGIGDLDPQYLAQLTERLDVNGRVQVQDTEGAYTLCDTKGAYVSFLNLASVRALSEFTGQEILLSRFRMNVLVEGLEPFEELDWVDGFPGKREIAVGSCRFRVDDACERCRATEANPSTGQYDLEVVQFLREMMGQRGYKSPHRGVASVMGILAAPLTEGIIRRKDPVRLL